MFAAGGGGGGSGDGSRDGISDSISGGSGGSGSGGIPSGGISQEPSQSQLEINICGVDPGGGVEATKKPSSERVFCKFTDRITARVYLSAKVLMPRRRCFVPGIVALRATQGETAFKGRFSKFRRHSKKNAFEDTQFSLTAIQNTPFRIRNSLVVIQQFSCLTADFSSGRDLTSDFCRQ